MKKYAQFAPGTEVEFREHYFDGTSGMTKAVVVEDCSEFDWCIVIRRENGNNQHIPRRQLRLCGGGQLEFSFKGEGVSKKGGSV
jgi:hypothetical protein